MTSKNQVLQKLQGIMGDLFPENRAEITATSQQLDIEGWDSLGHLNLFMTIEQEFKISSTMDEITNATSVGEIIDLLISKAMNE